jgi:carotenoid cleavage dioxygenase
MGGQRRYGYTGCTAGFVAGDHSPSMLIKYGYKQGSAEHHVHGKGRLGGEGVFVPRLHARDEDDGLVVTYAYDAADDTSEMAVIEAQNFRAPPVARVRITARVPYGFHGAWIAGGMLWNQG